MTEHDSDGQRVVTLAEASSRLGLTPSRLRQLALRGELPGAAKVGTQWVVGESTFDTFVHRRRAAVAPRRSQAPRAAPQHNGSPGAPSAESAAAMVDRVAELAELRRIIAAPPAIAVVVGEAGAGKTRLVTEALAREQPVARVAIGRARPQREPFLLGPLVEAARSLTAAVDLREPSAVMGALRLVLPELGRQLPPAPDAASPLAERHLLFSALAELLTRAGPCICVLEDLHWADRPTHEFLAFLVERMPKTLTVIVTFRREEVHAASPLVSLTTQAPHDVARAYVEVMPLSAQDVGRLAGDLLGGVQVSDEFATCLHERTLGIPLAVEAVARLLEARPALLSSANAIAIRHELDALALPRSLKDAVVAAAAALTPDARRLIDAAAVSGEPVDFDLLAHIAAVHPPADFSALRSTLEAGLLSETADGHYGFRHALARQAVYESIPIVERRRLHLRTARAIESRSPEAVGQLAHQYRAAERSAMWLQYAERAADTASDRRDFEAAVEFLLPAVASDATPASAVARLGVKLAGAALSGHVLQAETLAALRDVVERRPLPVLTRGQLRGFVALLLTETGQPAEGYRTHAKAAIELRSNPELAAVAMANLALPTSFEGREVDHRRSLGRAIAFASRVTDERTRFGTEVVAALVPVYFGDEHALDAVAALPWENPPDEKVEALLWLSSHLVGGCIVLGHDRVARTYLGHAEALASRVGRDRFRPLREAGEVLLALACGEWHGLDLRARALGDRLAVEFPAGAALVRAAEGPLLVARGDALAATGTLRDAAMLAESTGVIPALATARAHLSRLALQSGRTEAALDEAQRGLDPVSRKGIWTWAGEIAPALMTALLANNELAQARGLVRHLERGLRSRDAPLPAAALAMCRGALHEHADELDIAAAAYSDAAELYAGMPRPYEEMRARMAQGRTLLRLGRTEGSALLVRAVETFETLGAADAAEVRAICRKNGVVLPSRMRGVRRQRYGNTLSPQEVKVVELVAAGHSTNEIGDALFLAPRTVMHHVNSAMRKLGVHSRVALVSVWLRGGGATPDK